METVKTKYKIQKKHVTINNERQKKGKNKQLTFYQLISHLISLHLLFLEAGHLNANTVPDSGKS